MRTPKVTIISAMGENRVIGAGDGMPWSVPEEYQHFLNTVAGQTVIFGRKSYEIFGADLDNAKVIIVTRQGSLPGALTASSLEEALRLAATDENETFVAGGASIYEQAIPLADRMLLSTIHGDFAGDAYFPEFDRSEWSVEGLEEHERYTLREWLRNQ